MASSNMLFTSSTSFVAAITGQKEGETYSSYQNKIYADKLIKYREPILTTKFDDLEEAAKQRLPSEVYWFAAGGASTQKTVQNNLLAFDEFRIVPRMMRPALPKRPLSRTLFSRTYPAPITMAPIGVQSIYHPDGEIAVAKVFGELGLPFTISTVASHGLAGVAAANGKGNPRWFQLYWPNDEELTRSFLRTARKEGYDVLVVTADTWSLSWRPYDLNKGYSPFPHGVGTAIGLEDPYAHSTLGFDASSPTATPEQKRIASLYHMGEIASGVSPTWDRLKILREEWGNGPILLKGVQCVEDARMALECGLDGVVVSNHGGRQVDGAIGSLQALPKIVDAVGGKIVIGFDSGVRCGADIFKALALGADFVQIGRPVLWGLALAGEDGVRHVVKSLLADFDLHVGLSGCRGLEDVGRHCLAYKNGEYLTPQ